MLGIFLFTKLQLVYNDSPCAVLGTQSPVSMSDVKKAFRTVSMCTHPDRLRGRLGRPPTDAEKRRGEVLFNRYNTAKEDLAKLLRGKKTAACYQGELELALVQFCAEAGKGFAKLGLEDYWMFLKEFVYNIVTFQSGIVSTLLSMMWFMFVFRYVKGFFLYLWRQGLIRGVLAIVTTVIIGPIPTVFRFVLLPALRLLCFTQGLLVDATGLSDNQKEKSDDGVNESSVAGASEESKENATDKGTSETEVDEKANGKKEKKEKKTPAASTAGMAVATDGPARNLRQRKKKEPSNEEKEKKNQEILQGETPTMGDDPIALAGPMPEESAWKCVLWARKDPVKARQDAANAVQFDMLLILTKPVIPLACLIAVGQVWNGLFSSLFIGHALRRWVPQMSYESHHLMCAFFGVVHTLLGVSASQVEDFANNEQANILHLAWSWSFKDVLSVMHMSLLGATVTASASLGNEPSYSSSFAMGLAVRIAIAQDSFRGLGFVSSGTAWMETRLRSLGVQIDAAEEVVAYSGDGIGDCGGGPFRMLFGDGPQAGWAALVIKAWLMLIPILATLQWSHRTVQAFSHIGKRWKTTRFVQRLTLASLAFLQVILIGRMELNASNGALGNFWVAMLFGCISESLLSTYEIRGSIRSLLFLALFLFI